MANAYKCDRCGEYHDHAWLRYEIQFRASGVSTKPPGDFDLCPDCSDAVAKGLNELLSADGE